MSEARNIIVPEELQDFITVEHCDDFPIERYMLTKEQAQIAKDILHIRKRVEELRAYNIDYLNATLLYGVPGTGKTTFGRYMAYKMDWDFAFINFANLVGGVMGDTSRNITRVFNFMAGQRCLFMMDELDCISVKRGNESSATGGELSRITITVMQNLDLYKRRKVESVLIAATNVISTIDPALMSRFAIKKEIKPWNNVDKEKFARKYLGTIDGLVYDPDNIHQYCTENSTLQQREIEADIVRNIGEWLDNGHTHFELKHIDERTSVY